mgnify:CR=1 FL=1
MKRRSMPMAQRAGATLLTAALLAGCALPPQPPPTPTLQVPTDWHSSAPAAMQGAVQPGWWQAFGDPALDGLVQTALAANTDLRVARARIAEYQARLTVAQAAQWPALNASFSPTRARSPSCATAPHGTLDRAGGRWRAAPPRTAIAAPTPTTPAPASWPQGPTAPGRAQGLPRGARPPGAAAARPGAPGPLPAHPRGPRTRPARAYGRPPSSGWSARGRRPGTGPARGGQGPGAAGPGIARSRSSRVLRCGHGLLARLLDALMARRVTQRWGTCSVGVHGRPRPKGPEHATPHRFLRVPSNVRALEARATGVTRRRWSSARASRHGSGSRTASPAPSPPRSS